MLHRFVDASIARPDCTRGWFWQHELEAAQRAGLIDSIECEEWWTYAPCDCHPMGTSAVAMVATDGVYFASPHPGLRISSALGDWSTSEKANLTLFDDDSQHERQSVAISQHMKTRPELI